MPQRRWFSWLTLSLWIAGALIVGRIGAVVANALADPAEGSQALELALWRLHSRTGGLFWFALFLGGLTAAAALWIARRRALVLVRFAAIVTLGTGLYLYLLRGWTPVELPDLADPFGPFKLQGFASLFGLACACAVLVALAAFSIRYDTTGETPFADVSGLVLGLVAVVVGPLCVGLWASSSPPYLTWFEPAHDLLAEHGFEVRREHPSFPVRVDNLDPFAGQRDPRLRRALIVPPPGEVAFGTPADGEKLVLRTSMAIDGSFRPAERMTVRFSIAVDGEVVSTEDVTLEEKLDASLRNWRTLGGEAGFPLEPGSEVVLSTRVVQPVGVRAEDLPQIPAGFSELVLERERQKTRRRATDDAPNVVLIVLDSLRADRLSCYGQAGYAEPLTPAIDALAARGTLYESAYADASWSEASQAALLSGLGSERHGLVEARDPLAEARETLAEVLSRERYLTAAWVENTAIDPARGFGQGFDRFDARSGEARLEQAVAKWVEESRDTPFFLYLQSSDTRMPYRFDAEAEALVGGRKPADYPPRGPAQELLDEAVRLASGALTLDDVVSGPEQAWTRAAYDAAVHAADGFVARTLALLEQQGLERRTIVVVTSDHGEELFEHGFVQHGHDLWEELVRVPLVLAGPGIPAGVRVATPVSNRHVAPTLARLAGSALPDVEDALDLARPAGLAPQPVYFSSLVALRSDPRNGRTTAMFGVRDGRWSAILTPQASGPRGLRLFDLEADPRQDLDLAEQEPERASELGELLARHFASLVELAARRAAEPAPASTGEQPSGRGKRGGRGARGGGG